MPNYQMILLLPSLGKQLLKPILKRNAEYIFETGGVLRKMENLGAQTTPLKIVSHGKGHREAHYFLFDFDIGVNDLEIIKDKFKRDLDVVRITTFKQSEQSNPKTDCTLWEDLLPPPYRPDVIKMQNTPNKESRKLARKKFRFNTGLDYDPF